MLKREPPNERLHPTNGVGRARRALPPALAAEPKDVGRTASAKHPKLPVDLILPRCPKSRKPIQGVLIVGARVFGAVLRLSGVPEALDAPRFLEARLEEEDWSEPPQRDSQQSLTELRMAVAAFDLGKRPEQCRTMRLVAVRLSGADRAREEVTREISTASAHRGLSEQRRSIRSLRPAPVALKHRERVAQRFFLRQPVQNHIGVSERQARPLERGHCIPKLRSCSTAHFGRPIELRHPYVIVSKADRRAGGYARRSGLRCLNEQVGEPDACSLRIALNIQDSQQCFPGALVHDPCIVPDTRRYKPLMRTTAASLCAEFLHGRPTELWHIGRRRPRQDEQRQTEHVHEGENSVAPPNQRLLTDRRAWSARPSGAESRAVGRTFVGPSCAVGIRRDAPCQ